MIDRLSCSLLWRGKRQKITLHLSYVGRKVLTHTLIKDSLFSFSPFMGGSIKAVFGFLSYLSSI